MRLLGALLVLALLAASPAAAEDDPQPPITGGTNDGGFWGAGASSQSGSATEDSAEPSSPTDAPDGPVILIGQAACPAAQQGIPSSAVSVDVSVCDDPDPDAPPKVTPADARRAFEELRLPASTLVIEPPDALTLVNFATNFYTPDTAPLSRTVTLLGQQVTIEATPSTYTWTFGDGEQEATSDPGAPYPDLRVTHDYARVGTYDVTLATTFTGRFRVGQGGWQDIPGTVTVTGPAQPLRAIEATPQLVGH